MRCSKRHKGGIRQSDATPSWKQKFPRGVFSFPPPLVPCFVAVLIIIFRFEERKESKEKRLVSNEWTKTRERRERREALLVEGMRFDRTKVTSVTSRALDRPRGDPSFRKLRRIIRLSRQAVVLHQNSSAPLIHFPIHAFVPSPDTLCVLAFFLNFFPSAVLFSLRR